MDTNMNPTNPMGPSMESPKESSVGPVIGTIIILAVIVLGGLYFWNQRGERVMDETELNTVINEISTQSQSDDTASIDADLKATDVDNLDQELNAS